MGRPVEKDPEAAARTARSPYALRFGARPRFTGGALEARLGRVIGRTRAYIIYHNSRFGDLTSFIADGGGGTTQAASSGDASRYGVHAPASRRKRPR